MDSPLSNCSNIPIEAIDMEHEILPRGGVRAGGGLGAEEANGGAGLGIRRVYEVLADDVE